MSKLAFVINPVSGGVSKTSLIKDIYRVVDTRKYQIEITTTLFANHAFEIVSKSSADIIVVVGGDGTVNETASGIVGSDKVLGIVPFGSGNGLARHLGINMDKLVALDLINQSHVVKIDTGTINGRPFCCSCGIGLDACVDHRYSQMGTRGLFSYIKSALLEWRNHKPFDYVINIDGEIVSGEASMITVGNANQWGNNAYITPTASVCDGYLDVCIMDPISLKDVPSLVFKLFTKRLPKSRHAHYYLGKEINIHRETSGQAHFDGEPVVLGKDINISVCEKSLNVIVPPGRKI